MKVKDVMTPSVETVAPSTSLQEAAERMKTLDVGPLPVCEGRRVVGVITDRDITVRATAVGCDPRSTLVGDAMSTDVVCCFDDQDIREAEAAMAVNQVRRLLVLSRANDLVGIVSLGDLATEAGGPGGPGEGLRKGSEPA